MDPSLLFDHFAQANTFRAIQQLFYQICVSMDIDPTDSGHLYEQIRTLDQGKANSKAEKLWQLLDKRRSHAEYCRQTACNRLNVLVIGAGPCGLRAAIECAILGAHVVVVEQRDKFSRNNVLHLWEFVIQDLKALGAKIFYPKFCTGSLEHISIRQLQCILLKVALVLGVQVHENISFLELAEPEIYPSGRVSGWRAKFDPHGHVLSEYEFDALIGADGKRNTLADFPRQVMRGKLAIGITANFMNNRTSAEEKVQEISGVAYIFNQAFFKDMFQNTGIHLENIVYYKDDTHYFVMCAKKQSLLQKGVIKQDHDDTATLLSRDNVDQEMLCKFAAQAADFATNGKLPQLVFAQNSRGQPDVAMFDFTALYSAVYSSRIVERNGRTLILTIVGDSLHEPFWPTGSGCARGFLGVFDSAWMLRSFGLSKAGPTEILAERDNVFKLLAQTTKENMCKSIPKYTIDPKTRYVRIEKTVDPDRDVCEQVDTDNPRLRPTSKPLTLRNTGSVHDSQTGYKHRYRLWRFCNQALMPFKLKVVNFKTNRQVNCWGDGRALAALIAKFRPDLIDFLDLCTQNNAEEMVQTVFSVAEQEFSVPRPCENHAAWCNLPDLDRIEYIGRMADVFRNDTELMQQIMSPTVRAGVLTRKRNTLVNVDASKAKKTDHIRRRAGDLLNAMASTSLMPSKMEKLASEEARLAGVELGARATQETDSDRHAVRLAKLLHDDKVPDDPACVADYKLRNGIMLNGTDAAAEGSTSQPITSKLDPVVVEQVHQYVSGQYVKDMEAKLYAEKYHRAQATTRRMDPEHLQGVENKLEETALGLFDEKDRNRALSSLDEKVMRLKAAEARERARRGFAEDGKYKEIDEKLKKVDNALKMKGLVGLDAVSKAKPQRPLPKQDSVTSPKQSPPPPPPKTTRLPDDVLSQRRSGNEESPGSVTFRSTTNMQFSRRPTSMPVVDSYASVNPRRHQNCAICGTEAYLAEQMHLEKMTIHKSCFKCAYCERPLRLGHCVLDRTLMADYGPKWFCQQHTHVPPSEKIARIQKLRRRTYASDGKENRTAVAVVAPNSVNGTLVHKDSDDSPKIPSPLVATTTALVELTKPAGPSQQNARVGVSTNSPTALQTKTMEKIRARQIKLDAASVLSGEINGIPPAPRKISLDRLSLASGTHTPPEERAEFECYRQNLETAKQMRRMAQSESVDSASTDEGTLGSRTGETVTEHSESQDEEESEEMASDFYEDANAASDECSTSEDEGVDDDIWTEFHDALETTLTQNLSAQTITDEKAKDLIETFNRRRSSIVPPRRSTPSSTKSVSPQFSSPISDFDKSAYYTPRQSMTASRPSTIYRVAVTVCEPTSSCLMDTPRTHRVNLRRSSTLNAADDSPSMAALRERHHHQLELMNERHRQQARMKTDEELEANAKRKSTSPQNNGNHSVEALRSLRLSSPAASIRMETQAAAEASPQAKAEAEKDTTSSKDRTKNRRLRDKARRSTVAIDVSREKLLAASKRFASSREGDAHVLIDGTTRIRVGDETDDAADTTPASGVRLRAQRRNNFTAERRRSRSRGELLREEAVALTPLSVSPSNIRRVQREAERIIRKKEEERQRSAQDIQRGLDETENRIAEVRSVGADLEKTLERDPENRWLLEQWLYYVQEMKQLQLREQDLNRRAKEISVAEEYRRLKQQLHELQSNDSSSSGDGISPNAEMEQQLMQRMIQVLEEHKRIKAEMNDSMKQNRHSVVDIDETLDSSSSKPSYKQFEPVFTTTVESPSTSSSSRPITAT